MGYNWKQKLKNGGQFTSQVVIEITVKAASWIYNLGYNYLLTETVFSFSAENENDTKIDISVSNETAQ